MNYFNKFPLINYDGQLAVNLLTRAQISPQTRAQKTIYYPYTIRDYDRADNLSENYYDSPEYTWLIWMTNDMIDPYYDYPLSDEDLDAYITDKYGSIAAANRTVKYYRVKWANEEAITSTSDYEALDSRYKKYYDPVVDYNYGITGYKRKRNDVTVNTNKVLQIIITAPVTNHAHFTKGEEIYKQGDTSVYAQCIHDVDYPVPEDQSSVVGLQHIVGSFQAGDVMVGKTSGSTATIYEVNTISETLASTEADYWEAVSCYDFEYELNQRKKEIKLLDNRYRNQVESELQRVMSTQ